MAVIGTLTQTGLYCTCTGGTAAPALVTLGTTGKVAVSNGQSLRIVGVASGGAATTDICTVQDGSGNFVFVGASSVLNAVNSVQLGGAIRVTGLQVGFAGSTTGYCMIYFAA
jgi:Flp pilus assembly secretin CpaC